VLRVQPRFVRWSRDYETLPYPKLPAVLPGRSAYKKLTVGSSVGARKKYSRAVIIFSCCLKTPFSCLERCRLGLCISALISLCTDFYVPLRSGCLRWSAVLVHALPGTGQITYPRLFFYAESITRTYYDSFNPQHRWAIHICRNFNFSSPAVDCATDPATVSEVRTAYVNGDTYSALPTSYIPSSIQALILSTVPTYIEI